MNQSAAMTADGIWEKWAALNATGRQIEVEMKEKEANGDRQTHKHYGLRGSWEKTSGEDT